MSQGLRQASVRAVSGTTLTYEGDWHAMWDVQGIAAGTFNERMIRYANTKLSATYANVNDAMQALAVAGGATNFGSLGTYSFALGPVPVNSVAPTLSPTTAAIGVLITCGTGTWSNTPTSYAYQWMRGGVDIGSATASTYTTVLADDATTLTCKVRASNANGPAAGYTTTSNSCAVGAASLLLDSYTVGVAHSLRKLCTAYAGNCVRIRRSSDNAEQNFGFVSNVVDTAGIATFIGGGTGYAVTWFDQSGNSVDIVHATAAWQPQFSASSIGGKPTLIFDDTSALQSASVAASTIASATQATIMGAWKISSLGPGTSPLTFGPVGNIIYIDHAVGNILFDFGDYTFSRQTVAHGGAYLDANHIAEFYRATDGTQAVIIDGGTLISGAKTTGPTATSTITMYFRGEMAEMFILKTDIGSSPRATVRADMGAYYGITVA